MTLINISYEIRGTAPRTLFDILSAEEDTEGFATFRGDLFDAEYGEYGHSLSASGTKPSLLS